MISCFDAQGSSVSVAPETVTFRPAVYGIFIENEQVLLLRHPQRGLWQPPGRILQSHEIPMEVVRHHFREVTGVMPLLGPLLYVEEQHWLDEEGRAWHLSVLYYALDRTTSMATTLADIQGSQETEWVPLDTLQRQEMQFGYQAIQAGRLRLKL